MTVRWGILGCGSVTERKSGPAFKTIRNSDLVAVMRRNGTLAESYAKRHNVPFWTTSAAELINRSDVDAIYIASPPGCHLELALEACRAGKPTYVEKPMARNFRECRQMVESFTRANVPLFVAYYRRALPRFLKVKELIASGEIGEINSVSCTYSNSFHRDVDPANLPWRVQAEHSGGGLFLDLGSHTLDILDFIFGPLSQIVGKAANLQSPYAVEDFVTMTFRIPSGVLGTASWNFSSTLFEDSICISGTRGKITLSTFGNEPIRAETIGRIHEFDLPNPWHIQEPLIQTIVEELEGNGVCPSTGLTAARTSNVMDIVLCDYYRGRDDFFWTRPNTWSSK